MRDTLIILLIIVLVIAGNVISRNILKQDSQELISQLEELKQDINNENAIKEDAEVIKTKWEEIDKRWSIFVTHQELDLIKTAITLVKSGIEINDVSISYEQIDNSIFLLSHIEEKGKLSLKNIF